MSKCPKCGTENRRPTKEWVGGAKTSKPMKVQRFICSSCGSSYVSWLDKKTGQLRVMTRK